GSPARLPCAHPDVAESLSYPVPSAPDANDLYRIPRRARRGDLDPDGGPGMVGPALDRWYILKLPCPCKKGAACGRYHPSACQRNTAPGVTQIRCAQPQPGRTLPP